MAVVDVDAVARSRREFAPVKCRSVAADDGPRSGMLGGLTYEETALRLNLPVGTLKSRIRAALSTMRGFLEGAS